MQSIFKDEKTLKNCKIAGQSPKGDGTGPFGPGYIILKHYYSDDKLSDNLPLIYDNH